MAMVLARIVGRVARPKTSGRWYDKAGDGRTVVSLFMGPMVSSFEELHSVP
jgi:hypothetical protein